MKKADIDYAGYIKFYGEKVNDGILDTKSAANALLGTDEALRYFVKLKNPSWKKIQFNLPVKMRQGSWEIILIPGISLGAVIYMKHFFKKAAEDGFLETGIAKDLAKVIRESIISLYMFVEIAKFMASSNNDQIKTTIDKLDQTNVILSSKKKKLTIKRVYYDEFVNAPKSLINKLASVIDKDRELEIGCVLESGDVRSTQIPWEQKQIFSHEEEFILPELEHGKYVELEGEIIRGNESTNTLGFRFKEHTITAKPLKGTLAEYKDYLISGDIHHIFTPVKMVGQVDRMDVFGEIKKKRPQILFTDIIPVERREKYALLNNETIRKRRMKKYHKLYRKY